MREKATAQKVGDFTADWLTNPDRAIKIDGGANGSVAALKLSIHTPGGETRTLVMRAANGPLTITFE